MHIPDGYLGPATYATLFAATAPFWAVASYKMNTRMAAGALANVLDYLSDPHAPAKLARTYEVWRREARENPEAWDRVSRVSEILRRGRQVEDYLWPSS